MTRSLALLALCLLMVCGCQFHYHHHVHYGPRDTESRMLDEAMHDLIQPNKDTPDGGPRETPLDAEDLLAWPDLDT